MSGPTASSQGSTLELFERTFVQAATAGKKLSVQSKLKSQPLPDLVAICWTKYTERLPVLGGEREDVFCSTIAPAMFGTVEHSQTFGTDFGGVPTFRHQAAT